MMSYMTQSVKISKQIIIYFLVPNIHKRGMPKKLWRRRNFLFRTPLAVSLIVGSIILTVGSIQFGSAEKDGNIKNGGESYVLCCFYMKHASSINTCT